MSWALPSGSTHSGDRRWQSCVMGASKQKDGERGHPWAQERRSVGVVGVTLRVRHPNSVSALTSCVALGE